MLNYRVNCEKGVPTNTILKVLDLVMSLRCCSLLFLLKGIKMYLRIGSASIPPACVQFISWIFHLCLFLNITLPVIRVYMIMQSSTSTKMGTSAQRQCRKRHSKSGISTGNADAH